MAILSARLKPGRRKLTRPNVVPSKAAAPTLAVQKVVEKLELLELPKRAWREEDDSSQCSGNPSTTLVPRLATLIIEAGISADDSLIA
ncbi:uncharacterized protein ATNIH1004_000455 [Aspergillus tanneri]|uniref:Uncharacterized protein n=1 Tax=Aspergillus tanneri TaxID=1220188 RepID=A0A5M9MWT3_9EURO|nr:uncharacterized protein ATNIH1004_000455 [Aspergillus tanneri]KAA8651565.1 hypothetical protein ATNIH1004_000455 [Aspergillus tanneri]